VGYESASQFSREFKRMRVRGRARCRAAPRIARQQDCQTCFMCELYCPEDALYVAPLADRPATAEELAGFATSQAGAYRRAVGWGRGRRSTAQDDASYELLGRTH
jgi:ferredoxin